MVCRSPLPGNPSLCYESLDILVSAMKAWKHERILRYPRKLKSLCFVRQLRALVTIGRDFFSLGNIVLIEIVAAKGSYLDFFVVKMESKSSD